MSKKTYDFSDFDSRTPSINSKPNSYDFSDFDASNVSKLESGVRGAAQGASLGFADEVTGLSEAAIDWINSNPESFMDNYKKHRDESRVNYKSAQDANPYTYGTGEIGGSVATALVPGLNVAKGASLGARVAANAALGGVAGLGLSDANNAIDLTKDTATGAALAGGMSYGIDKALPVLKQGAQYLSGKASEFSDEAVKKAGKGIFGVDEKATENYLQNSKRVNNAHSMGELADAVLNKSDEGSALNELRKKTSELSTDSWNKLNKENGIPKLDILTAIDDTQNGLLVDGNVIGKSQERAYNTLKDLSKQIKNLPDDVNEGTLKRLIQTLDENINWNNPEMGPTNDAIKNIRTFIDQRLKTQNTGYKDAMSKVEDVTKATQQVKSVFENRLNPENYDKFNKQVKNLVNKDDMSAANLAVDKIKQHTGYDLKSDIVDSWTKAQFEKGDANGSRKTLLGGMIGTGIGTALGNPVLGGALGSSAGYTVDRYAGPIFKKLLDGKITAQEFNQNLAPRLGKFSQPLMQAIQKGNQSVAATMFILQQNHPEFRQKIKEIENED